MQYITNIVVSSAHVQGFIHEPVRKDLPSRNYRWLLLVPNLLDILPNFFLISDLPTGPWSRNRPLYLSFQGGTLIHSPLRTSSFRNDSSLEQPRIWNCKPPERTVSGRSCLLGLVRRPTPPQAWPYWRLCLWENFQSLSSKASCRTYWTVIIIQRQVIILRPLLDADLVWPPPLLLFPVRLQGINAWDCIIDACVFEKIFSLSPLRPVAERIGL